MNIVYEKIRDVKIPAYSSDGAAALDFFIPNDIIWETKTIRQGESVLIPSGIKILLPPNICLIALNKSGLGSKGLNVGACLIDPDYRGEIHLNVFNTSYTELTIYRGEKLVQFIAIEFKRINLSNGLVLANTERADGNFGSTGKF